MFHVSIEPVTVEHDFADDSTLIHFVADARDAATIIHAYMTTATKVTGVQVMVRDSFNAPQIGHYLTRADIASPAPESFNDAMSYLFWESFL